MEHYKVLVNHIIYQNSDNGYTVLRVNGDKIGNTTIVIRMAEVTVGMTLDIQGEWVKDAKYGMQFKVSEWEEALPTDLYGIEKYLCSGLIKGIGPKFAHKIVLKLGKEALDIIDSKSDKLLTVPQLGPKKAQKIWDSWDEQKHIRKIMAFLKQFDVSTNTIIKIYKRYGDDAVEIIKENPYQLTDIDGIGFLTADRIALKIGIEKDSPLRVRCGLLYSFNERCENGDTFLFRNELIEEAFKLLEVDSQIINECINNLIESERLILEEDDAIYLPPFYYAEKNVSWSILDILAYNNLNYIDLDIRDIGMDNGVEYDETQIESILKAVNSKVMVLTGGPGTGKTTVTRGIISAMELMNRKILLAAPTGRAAKRMSEATGKRATTIHRLLEYHPEMGYRRNEDNPLDGDVLILDECSMINILLMSTLLKAIPSKMQLILVGDADQLPSIGAGNVLNDIIKSEAVPTVKLEKIYRQAQDSEIIMNAHKVNKGNMPTINNNKDSDFFFMCEYSDDIPFVIKSLIKERLPKAYGTDPYDIQILTPMKKGDIGTISLNNVIQEAINPEGEFLKYGDVTYRIGDKVMQNKNNYQKEVFNGDMGTIVGVDTEDRTITIDFDDVDVVYDSSELNEIMLAYAVTIHKSQGSEYPIVIIPVVGQHKRMLERNLIYTGITRAKKLCILIGNKESLQYAVRNITVNKRNTYLKERLQRKL